MDFVRDTNLTYEQKWDSAYKWQDLSNSGKNEDNSPKWRFDCCFKLDFDGPLMSVSSRFYPPNESYGIQSWSGDVCIYMFGKEMSRKDFKCNSIDELKVQVESYVEETKNKIYLAIQSLF